jgi:hypothetical protein
VRLREQVDQTHPQRAAHGDEHLGRRLLAPPLDLREVGDRDAGLDRDVAQRASLGLAARAQDRPDEPSQQGFARHGDLPGRLLLRT